MSKPNPDYRENPLRAIFLVGEINQQLVNKLTPEILRLRHESDSPITVYVDSIGGSVYSAELIRNLIKAQKQNGTTIRLVTVATGMAASAAADFLILGDYPIVYPHTRIIYHGTRRTAPDELTVETASSIIQNLRQTNERFAARLARVVFKRFVSRIISFKEQFQTYINSKESGDIKSLIDTLIKNLSEDAIRLVRRAGSMQEKMSELSKTVMQSIRKRKRPLDNVHFEIEVLKGVLHYQQKELVKKKILLSDGELNNISIIFEALMDYHFGGHRGFMAPWIRRFGALFLSEEEKQVYEKLPSGQVKENQKWLREHTAEKIRPLWYFIVSACRELQTDDYELMPEDAFWLGLIDEILGSDLPCERMFYEEASEEGKVAEQSKVLVPSGPTRRDAKKA